MPSPSDFEYIKELERLRDIALAENFKLKNCVERYAEKRVYFLSTIKNLRKKNSILRRDLSNVSKRLHTYTGK
jgi:hypothetical protein